MLDEAEAHQRLVARAQAVAGHGQDGRRLPDTAAVHCTQVIGIRSTVPRATLTPGTWTSNHIRSNEERAYCLTFAVKSFLTPTPSPGALALYINL